MTPAPAKKAADLRAWIEELKSNRKTQLGLLGFLAMAIYLVYSLASSPAPKPKRKPGSLVLSGTTLNTTQITQLRPLVNLAKLGQAGELPKEDRMYRDLFVFDMPAGPPQPPPKPVVVPPPPPESPAEKSAREAREREANARREEEGAKPTQLRYIGCIISKSRGNFGAFMKGEEAMSIKQGELANPKWRLVEVTKDAAVFQNLRYSDLKHRLTIVENAGATNRGGSVTNEY